MFENQEMTSDSIEDVNARGLVIFFSFPRSLCIKLF